MFLILFLLCFSFLAQAEVFQWIDDQGKYHFSDKARQGSKVFQLEKSHSYYQVKKIYDGDTILLKNGKKIRFLGVNTPEVEGRNKSAQAGGEEAKQWLVAKLKNKKVRLEMDVEKKDKYGRVLAHVFTEDKQHLNLELIKLGLGNLNIYPPSLKYLDAMLNAAKKAESSQLGIWARKEYKLKKIRDITKANYKGWQRVVGIIKNIRHTRKNSYLNFSDGFSVRIAKNSFKYFPALEKYVGQRVEVNGWINKRKDKFSMFVRHSSAIKL